MRGGIPAVSDGSSALHLTLDTQGAVGSPPCTLLQSGLSIRLDCRLMKSQITLPAGYLGSSFIGAALIACVSPSPTPVVYSPKYSTNSTSQPSLLLSASPTDNAYHGDRASTPMRPKWLVSSFHSSSS